MLNFSLAGVRPDWFGKVGQDSGIQGILLAHCLVALAKSRVWRGLATATGNSLLPPEGMIYGLGIGKSFISRPKKACGSEGGSRSGRSARSMQWDTARCSSCQVGAFANSRRKQLS